MYNNRFPVAGLNPVQGEALALTQERAAESVARLVQDGVATKHTLITSTIAVNPASSFTTGKVVASFSLAGLTAKLEDYSLIDLSGQAANYTVYVSSTDPAQAVGTTFAPASAWYTSVQAIIAGTAWTTYGSINYQAGAVGRIITAPTNLYITIVVAGATTLAANANNGLVLRLGL